MVRALILSIVITVGAIAAAVQPPPVAAQDADPYDLVAVAATHLDQFWFSVFDSLGGIYISPNNLYWYNTLDYPGPTLSACGEVDTFNAMYCPLDMSIYLDDEFIWHLYDNFGDYAVVSTMAHEWAHHIQFHVYGLNLGFNQSARIAFELQADCITGLHTRHFAELGWLDDTDAVEAYFLAASTGDDVMGVPLLAWSHGSSADRTTAFLTGYTYYTFAACGLPF